MARAKSIGFELNSASSGVEITTPTGSFSVQGTTVRSGSYAARLNPSATTAYFETGFQSTTTVMFVRFYLRIASLPGSTVDLMRVFGLKINNCGFRLTSTGALQLYNFEDSLQIGSDSSALSTNTWYRIEFSQDTTTLASTSVEGRIDGTAFASGTANLVNRGGAMRFGTATNATFDLYIDDIALNNDSGSFQNSWPGEGAIIHLKPDGAGDTAEWNDGTGTTFAEVDEVTPDTGTYIAEADIDFTSEFTLEATPSAIASNATINVVQVGVRYSQESAAAVSAIALLIRDSVGGTQEQGSNITMANNTTWYTNGSATNADYTLTLYDLPGGSTTAWTKSTLDTATIGVKRTVDDGLNENYVSTLWLVVDYTTPTDPQVTYDSTDFTNPRWRQGVKLYTP